ncbi:hypothetical protein DITRI_Ditri13aG0056200 [Diplodiscus trichospermus]
MSIYLEIGFRFLPPDEEIISFFLRNKVYGREDRTLRITEVDLLEHEPWHLPALSKVQSKYQEWLFFYKLSKTSEGKNDRATKTGFWKSTGQDRKIRCGSKEVIGTKKTLVYYDRRTPHAVKTEWVMHEYRATAEFIPPRTEQNFVVGLLRNKAAENPENSNSYDGQPSIQSDDNEQYDWRNIFCTPEPEHEFLARTFPNQEEYALYCCGYRTPDSAESSSMDYDYEIALKTQMKEGGIVNYDLPPLDYLLDLPSSDAVMSNDQNKMEEEDFTLENVLASNDSADDEQNDRQAHFDYSEIWCDIPMPDRTDPANWERLYLQQMEDDPPRLNPFLEEILMDSSIYSETVEGKQINCLDVVREEKSVNSRTCKPRYKPRSHKSVVQRQPRKIRLQIKSLGKAISRGKARKSGVRGPVVELVQNKISLLQSNQHPKMDQNWNTRSDLKSRANDSSARANDSSGSGRKNYFYFLEMSQLRCKQDQPLVYVGKVLLGVVLFIFMVKQLIFIR